MDYIGVTDDALDNDLEIDQVKFVVYISLKAGQGNLNDLVIGHFKT